MLYNCLPEALFVARRATNVGQCGSVTEVNSKRLLALNLRKLGGAEFNFTPRSYVLVNDSLGHEFTDFVRDFKVSQAFAILKYVSDARAGWAGWSDGTCAREPKIEIPEGVFGREVPDILWEPGPDPTRDVTEDLVATAVAVTERALDIFRKGGCISSVIVSDEEWAKLQFFSPYADPRALDLDECALRAKRLLPALPLECQLSLLERNLWILKPSLNGGGNGRGILLIDRLPSSPDLLLSWVAALGRGGVGGASDALDGCLLQKLAETPHLVNQSLLQEVAVSHIFEDAGQRWEAASDQKMHGEMTSVNACSNGMFKYNLRLWILASMASPPEVWLYRDSYVDLAAKEFTADLEAASHVTNLQRGHRTCQRYWPLPDFAAYLRRKHDGQDIFGERILPQARAIIVNTFRALQTSPSSLLDQPSARLKRLGVDLLVDAHFVAWLMEFNVLRNEYGLKAAKGQTAKDELTRRLVEEETKLKASLVHGERPPVTWQSLSSDIVA